MLAPTNQALRAVATKQHGVFSALQAHGAGYDRHAIRWRVEAGAWETIARGVYGLPGAPDTWFRRLWTALLTAGPGAVVCHRSAAALWRLPGFQLGPVEVLAQHSMKNHRLRGGRFRETRQLPAHHVTTIDGVPVTTVERTLFDLAGAVHEQRADRAIENALAKRMTTMEALWATWADVAARNRPGTKTMRVLLLKRPGLYVARESELESRFSELLDRAGIKQPEWQVNLGDSDWIGRVDCVFRSAGLVVELDGRLGHVGELDEARDRQRDGRLTGAGWRVRRFTWDDVVFRSAWVIAELRRELAVISAVSPA